jgi:hypothetical protein
LKIAFWGDFFLLSSVDTKKKIFVLMMRILIEKVRTSFPRRRESRISEKIKYEKNGDEKIYYSTGFPPSRE